VSSMTQTSFALVMLGVAASVALLIGMVGIYGVVACAAAQRTREIGVRMALGAQLGDVSKLSFRHGLWLTTIGIASGIGIALMLTRVMSAFLFGVGPMAPTTSVAVSAVLAGMTLVPIYLPAHRRTYRCSPRSRSSAWPICRAGSCVSPAMTVVTPWGRAHWPSDPSRRVLDRRLPPVHARTVVACTTRMPDSSAVDKGTDRRQGVPENWKVN
jgi:hypothetical protein